MNAKIQKTVDWIKRQIEEQGSIKLQLDVKGFSTPERKAAVVEAAKEAGLKVTEDPITGGTLFEGAE
jgi:cell division protein FtsL